MHIIFLSGLFPDSIKNEIEKNSKGVIQYAANLLQWNFVKGLDNFCNLSLINLPFVGSYPFFYKKLFTKTFHFQHTKNSSDINLGFLNLFLIKNIHRFIKVKKQLYRILESNISSEDIYIICYAIHSPFLYALSNAKKKYLNVKTCLIAPDLPQYMSENSNIFYFLFNKINSFFIKKSLKQVDSFVLLSQYMNMELNIQEKPFIVIEGIFDNLDSIETKFDIKRYEDNNRKIIFYSGTLAYRYGIINLLNAFQEIKNDDYELWICGNGNSKLEIIKRAGKDNRIKYLGQLPYEKVLHLQTIATVLVNPRTSEGEYTKYSFPSKTIEYMASGTPCIIYKLKGIPSEYYNYCNIIEKKGIDALKEKIIEICELDVTIRKVLGQKAKRFIIENKNPYYQCSKIIQMLKTI